MKLQPLGDKVLVKRLDAAEKTKGGIYIPETAKEKPKQGEVIALGTGKLDRDGKKIAFNLKVGDKIYFTSYAGTEVKFEGDDFLLMSEDEVLAVIV